MCKILNKLALHKCKIWLIITGYIISMLLISLGISLTKDTKNNISSFYLGDPKNRAHVTINSANISNDFAFSMINKYTGDCRVMLNIEQDSTYRRSYSTFSLFLIKYDINLKLDNNIIQGRDFTVEETLSDEKIAIVGKMIYKTLPNKNYISIRNEEFKIIGVAGYNSKNSLSDYSVYIPMGNLPLIRLSDKQNISYIIQGNQNSLSTVLEKLEKVVQESDSNASISSNFFDPTLKNIFILWALVVVIAGTILSTTITSATKLWSFLVIDLERELTIKKMTVNGNLVIIKFLLFNSIVLSLCLFLIVIIIYSILIPYIQSILPLLEVHFAPINLIIILVASIITCVLPIIGAMRYDFMK